MMNRENIVSDCCGFEAVENAADLGICGECGEHCEYTLPENLE